MSRASPGPRIPHERPPRRAPRWTWAALLILALPVATPAQRPQPVRAQDTTRALTIDPTRVRAARPQTVQEKVVLDTRLWERVDTGAFKQQVVGRVAVPPESLRVAQLFRRDEGLRLEAPLVEIRTAGQTLALDLSIDPDPGLACSALGCEGTVHIGVIETGHPYDEIPLPVPLRIHLHGVDSVGPTPITLHATRVLRPVRVRSRTTVATLSVRPDGLPSVDVPLPVRALELSLSPATRAMDAWGLEEVDLNIDRVQGLQPGDTVPIRLEGVGLRVEPSVVRVSAAAGATARIRSRELGRGTVIARGPAYVGDAEATIEMEPPWSFFLFALAGGLAGALVAALRRTDDRTRSRRALELVSGALFGVIMATLTALGANLTEYPLPAGVVSEILAFAEAGFFAFMIDAILARLGAAPATGTAGAGR